MENFEKKFQVLYKSIPDTFQSLPKVQEALRTAGLESSNLIVGIDYTSSNQWTGKYTFGGQSLHSIGIVANPYEQALQIIGKTMEIFDDDKEIPIFGFGDATSSDKHVFSFNAENRPCHGFQHAVARYRQITPHVKLAGPTSFAPIVEAAVRIVEESGGQFHVLVIIADGQMTRSADTPPGQLSPQEKATVEAIVGASNFALAIVLVGVGDGPWDAMHAFDDSIMQRNFDNFQFVDFSSIMLSPGSIQKKESMFALAALMEIPFQYRAAAELGILGRFIGRIPPAKPLPPPLSVTAMDSSGHSQSKQGGNQSVTYSYGLRS